MKKRNAKKLVFGIALSVVMILSFIPQSFAETDAADEDSADSDSCTCTALCSEENVNKDCPVCSAEDTDLGDCKGEQPGEEDQTAGDSGDSKTLRNTLGGTLKTQDTGSSSAVYLDGENGNDSGDGSAGNPVLTFAKAKELLAENGTIYIVDTVTVSDTQSWSLDPDEYGSAIVTRGTDSNSDYFEGEMVIIKSGGDLTLSDITLDGGSKKVDGGTTASIVKMTESTLTLGDGAVLQNNYNDISGGGVHASDTCTVTMSEGSKIDNCGTWTDIYVGGGVALYNSTMNMTGGTITNCRANKGGGVAVIASTFNMSGGEITGCELWDYGDKKPSGLPDPSFIETTNAFGAGVLVSNGLAGGTQTSYAGTFANSSGVQSFTAGKSAFVMSGGSVHDNGFYSDDNMNDSNQTLIGGGICSIPHDFSNYLVTDKTKSTEAQLTITIQDEAKISANRAKYGGGIALMFTQSKLTMSGGKVTENAASFCGGGIFISTRQTQNGNGNRPDNTISGGEVSYNVAYSKVSGLYNNYGGGGIALCGWTNDNKSVQGGAKLILSGSAKISNNQALAGGGIFSSYNSSVETKTISRTESKVAITGNIAKSLDEDYAYNEMSARGGGIWATNSITIRCGTISGNTAAAKLSNDSDRKNTYSNGIWTNSSIYIYGDSTAQNYNKITVGENDDFAIEASQTANPSITMMYAYNDFSYYEDISIPITSIKPIDTTAAHVEYATKNVETPGATVPGDLLVYFNGDGSAYATTVDGYNKLFDIAENNVKQAVTEGSQLFTPSAAMLEEDPSLQIVQSEVKNIKYSKTVNGVSTSFGPYYLYLTYAKGVSVTYKANGGTGDDVVKYYAPGTTPNALANDPNSTSDNVTKFTKDNHKFTGWNTVAQPTTGNEGTAYVAGDEITGLTQDLILYAQWEEDENFTLTYETNGGTDVVDKDGNPVTHPTTGKTNSEKYYKNDMAPLVERTTEKSGYVFTGWYSDPELENYIPNQRLEIEGDTTVYAGWGFKVTFDPNEGTMTKPDDDTATDNGDGTYTIVTKEGKTVTEPAVPARDGYTFDGWYTSKDGGDKWDFATGIPTAEMTLYAHWTKNPDSGEKGGDKSGEETAKTPKISKASTGTKTGDTSNINIWIIVAIIAVAVIGASAGYGIYKKRHSQR